MYPTTQKKNNENQSKEIDVSFANNQAEYIDIDKYYFKFSMLAILLALLSVQKEF